MNSDWEVRVVERDDGSVVLGGPSGDETRNEKVQREMEGMGGCCRVAGNKQVCSTSRLL